MLPSHSLIVFNFVKSADTALKEKRGRDVLTLYALRGQLCDHYTFQGTCPPTPPLGKHFVLSEKKVLMLA